MLATREVRIRPRTYCKMFIAVAAVAVWVSFASVSDGQDAHRPSACQPVDVAVTERDNLELGVPGNEGLQVVNRRGYALGFSPRHKQPLWVAYRLTASEVTNVVVRRSDQFAFDPEIIGGSATLEDYRGSGYDRGHLAPAADMKWDAEVQRESFLLSNVSPQVNAFNGGIWKKLEDWCRGLARRRGSLWVVTGPIFPEDEEHAAIGPNKVTVPKFFYKVVYDEREGRMIGFVMPNKANKNIYKFAVSVDEVEEATGLDFFSKLPTALQNRLESECDTRKWNK